MAKKQFYLTEDDLRVHIDTNHKVTVYVVNKNKTAVKTIMDFFVGTQPSAIININPRSYYDKYKKIEAKYRALTGNKTNKELLKEIEASKKEEIDELFMQVRKALHKNVTAIECEDEVTPSGFVWLDEKHEPLWYGFLFNEEVDCFRYGFTAMTSDGPIICGDVLGRIYTREPKVFTSFDDLWEYEKELQERYDNHFDAKEGSEIRQKTEELLNF